MASIFNLRTFLFSAIFLLSVILNFYQFDKNPPGLYIDEVSIGVNAYSILTTGTDEHGYRFPLYFKSYGDYKLPVYIYLTSVSMSIFGKSEFAVRFPSAFLGTLTILFFYLLTRELIKSEKYSLLATFLLAVSPWFMHFVGPAFEATVGLFFFILAVYLYVLFRNKKQFRYLLVSILSFILTVYTYNSYKVITLLTFLLIIYDLIKNLSIFKNKFPIYAVILSVFVATLQTYLFNPSNTRFVQASAFNTSTFDNLILFGKNYLSYFSLDFLFNFGDGINRHQFLNFGILEKWTLPFLLLGFYNLMREEKSDLKRFTLGVLLVAPIPAALALPSPHTLRSFLLAVPYILITAFGIFAFFKKFRKHEKILSLVLSVIFIYEFAGYLHYGFFHYPKTALIDWGGGYKEVVQKVTALSAKYPDIVVLDNFAFTPEYFRFYNDSLKPLVINSAWDKKKSGGARPVLLITKDFGKEYPPSPKLIDTVYLPNNNRDIFAQFWELP